MSKNSKILIVTLLVLALIGGALFFTKPELFKGMLKSSKSIEKQSVTPRPGMTKPNEPEPIPKNTKSIPDINPDRKVIPMPDPLEKKGVNPRPGTWQEGTKPGGPEERKLTPDGSEKSVTVPDLIL